MAALAGVAATVLFASLANSVLILGHVQDFLTSVTPQAAPNPAYSPLVDSAVAICIALPGLVVAVLVMATGRLRGDGHTRCGTFGHILKGLSQLRCPECGTAI